MESLLHLDTTYHYTFYIKVFCDGHKLYMTVLRVKYTLFHLAFLILQA